MKKQILDTIEEVFRFKPEAVAGVILLDAGYTEEDFFDKTHKHDGSPNVINTRNGFRDASRNFPNEKTITEIRQWIKRHKFALEKE